MRCSDLNTYQALRDIRTERRAGSLATDPSHLDYHLLKDHSLETADPLTALSTSSASLKFLRNTASARLFIAHLSGSYRWLFRKNDINEHVFLKWLLD